MPLENTEEFKTDMVSATKTTKKEKKENQYNRVAHLIPEQTDIMDLILALFARNELCTDPLFHLKLKEIEKVHK